MRRRNAMALATALLTAISAAARAQDWIIGPFTRPMDAPVISPNPRSSFNDPITKLPVAWEFLHTFNPAASIAPSGGIAVIYRAEDASGEMRVGGHTSRLGLAESADGSTFTRRPAPVLFPAEDAQKVHEFPGGVEDPRLVRTSGGLYVLAYTQNARVGHVHTAGIATSRDLVHWTKHGPAFELAESGRYRKLAYKSAGILQELRHGRLVAVRLHGKYWMYWGEGTIGLATSADLLHWTPVVDPATGEPKVLLAARPGMFDSGFPEMGPPPVLTRRGIVVMYDAKNAPPAGNPAMELTPGTYSVGEALFSGDDPSLLLDRTSHPVFQPEKDYERSGQYLDGTTFAEGLVAYKGKWWMYYGCADSFVGVAVAPISAND